MKDLGFVHRYIPAPDAARADRVLLLLHGTGGDEDDLIPLGPKLDPNAALLSPRGKISEHGQLRFFRRLAEGVFDEEDVVRRAHELADFVIAAGSEYNFEPLPVVAVGYSNGANIAAAMLLLRPEVLAGAILLRAMVPLSSPPAPDLRGRRILISEGEQDPIVPMDHGRTLSAMLRNAGADVLLIIQAAGHSLVGEDIRAAQSWLRG
ncbi:MAG: alpha/beta hydrolase [Verrucomicrobiota bacterium]|nr:alpha/beta hydrolase [Verrucomicrobiota bacterium]